MTTTVGKQLFRLHEEYNIKTESYDASIEVFTVKGEQTVFSRDAEGNETVISTFPVAIDKDGKEHLVGHSIFGLEDTRLAILKNQQHYLAQDIAHYTEDLVDTQTYLETAIARKAWFDEQIALDDA